MHIAIAETEAELRRCLPVLRELRPHLGEAAALAQIGRQQAAYGFRLARLEAEGAVQCVAGYDVRETLCCGRILYVHDLVTAAAGRGRGHGAAMLAWLKTEARRRDCDALHLDSGNWRADAHRFYEREGMVWAGRHYAFRLA